MQPRRSARQRPTRQRPADLGGVRSRYLGSTPPPLPHPEAGSADPSGDVAVALIGGPTASAPRMLSPGTSAPRRVTAVQASAPRCPPPPQPPSFLYSQWWMSFTDARLARQDRAQSRPLWRDWLLRRASQRPPGVGSLVSWRKGLPLLCWRPQMQTVSRKVTAQRRRRALQRTASTTRPVTHYLPTSCRHPQSYQPNCSCKHRRLPPKKRRPRPTMPRPAVSDAAPPLPSPMQPPRPQT